MRPIEFRGLRVDGKGWVYGSLVKSGDCRCFIFPQGSALQKTRCGSDEYVGIFYEVLPETVGQYTGMKDRNGVKIWEGDILEFDTGQQGFISKDPVVWREDSCRFNFGTGLSWRDARYLEVIGNIHEEERQGE